MKRPPLALVLVLSRALLALAAFLPAFAPAARGAGNLPASPDAPVIPLYSGTAPGSENKTGDEQVRITDTGEHVVHNIHRPTLTVYLPPPATATGAAVVVVPGGGHRELWMDHEGYNVARWLADHGIAAFILKYRLAREEGSTYRVEVESLADAQRALELVHARAAEWHVDPARVGIIGFSAGGELAALAAARSTTAANRPAFQGLLYPGHATAIVPEKNSPPAFLAGGDADNVTPPDALAQVYLRFHSAGVPAELHIYTGAGHGFGLRATNKFPAGTWLDRFRDWLGERGFLATP